MSTYNLKTFTFIPICCFLLFQIGGVCFKYRDKGQCHRGLSCDYPHLKAGDTKKIECPVCQVVPQIAELCILDCGHFLCYVCNRKLLSISFRNLGIQCPVCRATSNVYELSQRMNF